jgi:hypothetical protein
MIPRETLEKLYLTDKLSVSQIAASLSCSTNKVIYWMNKYDIRRRTIGEALYQRHNPTGDPFLLKPIRNRLDAELWGMGIGLFWGEGNKVNRHSVRLGNTDPALLRKFQQFLVDLCGVDPRKLKYGLQIFTDIEPSEALAYWARELSAELSQFYKVTVTISGSLGTYRHKNANGVVTIYYHNKKLRDILVGMLPR